MVKPPKKEGVLGMRVLKLLKGKDKDVWYLVNCQDFDGFNFLFDNFDYYRIALVHQKKLFGQQVYIYIAYRTDVWEV